EAQRSQSTTTDCSTATESSKEYAPTTAWSSTYAITSNDYSRALESQGSTSRYQKKRWRMSSLMLYEKITRWTLTSGSSLPGDGEILDSTLEALRNRPPS